MSIPNFPGFDSREDLEDIAILRLDRESDLDNEPLAWHAWRMDIFWRSAQNLATGQQLFAVGFPSIIGRYDWENQRIQELQLVNSVLSRWATDSIALTPPNTRTTLMA